MKENNKNLKPKTDEEILNNLINKNIEGDILPQYQILVDSAKEISNQRESNNRYYLSLIIALFSISSFLSTYNKLFAIIPIVFIVGICKLWKKHLQEYKLLNKTKFTLINYLEKDLPVNAYTTEWELLKNKDYAGLTSWNEKIPTVIIWISLWIIILFILQLFYFFIH